MERNPMQPFLSLAIVMTLLGLTACAASPSASPPADVGMEQAAPTTLSPATATPVSPSLCESGDPHPIGESIAQTYEFSYEQVMIWFCEGYSFENILIALETSEAVGIPAEALLQMLQDKEWEEIWADVGFTGSP